MPKLSLNASKKTKHTPAGEIPVDWGAGNPRSTWFNLSNREPVCQEKIASQSATKLLF